MHDPLDPHLSPRIREALEDRYWRVIEQHADADRFLHDPSVLGESEHPALFADHGVVHVRDVAAGVLELLEVVDGRLLPSRAPDRRLTVQAVGVLTAYLHDIGMVETTRERRRVHPQWAAQQVYDPSFDEVVAQLIADGNPVVRRLASIESPVPLPTRVREVLAMSMCHSKSVVPADLLDDRRALRELVRSAVLRPLLPSSGDSPAGAHYAEGARAFDWLDSPDPVLRALADDVVDAVRVLRAADALRQRGTVLRTSAGYEMFLDPATADVVYALRTSTIAHTVHLRVTSPIGAGEATVRRTAVTRDGNLRVWFHVAPFVDDVVRRRAAANAAIVVIDVQGDVLPSFAGESSGPGLDARTMEGADMLIELAGHGSGVSFAELVATEIARRRPDLAPRVVVVDDDLPEPPDDAGERTRFEFGSRLVDDPELVRRVLAGFDARHPSPAGAGRVPDVDDVRLVRLRPGDTLITAGTAARHVYLPLDEGLEVVPLGGYRSSPLAAWELVGATGAVRQGSRNATVRATSDVDVVAIPCTTFVRSWFRPLGLARLVQTVTRDAQHV